MKIRLWAVINTETQEVAWMGYSEAFARQNLAAYLSQGDHVLGYSEFEFQVDSQEESAGEVDGNVKSE